MSLEAARDLSIPDLRVLNEKLNLECTWLRAIPLPPPVTSVDLLESEASAL